MPEVSEKMEDLSAALTTYLRRMKLSNEAYIENRLLLSQRMIWVATYLHPDDRQEWIALLEKDVELATDLGEIMELIGQNCVDFAEEAKRCLKSI